MNGTKEARSFFFFSQREDANKNVCNNRPRTEALDLTKKQLKGELNRRRERKASEEECRQGCFNLVCVSHHTNPMGGFFTHCDTRYGYYRCGLFLQLLCLVFLRTWHPHRPGSWFAFSAFFGVCVHNAEGFRLQASGTKVPIPVVSQPRSRCRMTPAGRPKVSNFKNKAVS